MTTLSRSANEFAVDLFQSYLRRHGDKYINLLLCPYLIYHSLAMMLVGARGATSQQLMDLLHMKRQQVVEQADQRHREFLWLTEQLIHGNHDFVHLASFIYLDKSVKRLDTFKTILKDYYETKPKKIDFEKVDETVKIINEDVARTTENIYNDILSKQEVLKLDKSMLLVNAVFFRGFWLSNFTEVKRAPFRHAGPKDLRVSPEPAPQAARQLLETLQGVGSKSHLDGNSAGKGGNNHLVNMMSKLDYLAVLADDQLDARIIRMPFEASDLHMLIVLPNDRRSNSAYLSERISASKIDSIMEECAIKSRAKLVRVTMPIFCVDTGKISIQSTLVTMGARDLFDRTKADMRGVCENKPIWLNKILHRCFIICDNRGSITSSSFEKARRKQASSSKGGNKSIPDTAPTGGKTTSTTTNGSCSVEEDFVADHPFMYLIVDSVTKTILLMGLFTDPSETLEVIHENQLSAEEAHQIYTEGVYRT